MPRLSSATWRPISINYTPGGMGAIRGVVIHIMEGTLAGTDSWLRNPVAQVSAHFGTGKGGDLYQWVDTADRAWAQVNGNPNWISVENEGMSGQTLTDAQLNRCADVLRWAHEVHGVPLQLADGPNGAGLGYHALGGAAWGGHYDCPGSPIIAQLGEIVKRAGGPASGNGGGSPAPSRAQTVINGLTYGYGAHGDQVTAVGRALVAQGCGKFYTVGPGPDWSDADTLNYQLWQQKLGYSGADADGVPGPASLTKLLGTLPSATPPPPPPAPPKPVYEPFPGADFFHRSPNSPIVTAMGRRLVAEGCSAYRVGPSSQWSDADRQSYAKWQRKMGYSGADADGWPGATSWNALRVPKV
jgi:hypothetical protein